MDPKRVILAFLLIIAAVVGVSFFISATNDWSMQDWQVFLLACILTVIVLK